MKGRCITTAVLLAVLALAAAPAVFAAEEGPPVRIAFDTKSKRMDLVTERELPDYTQAVRDSIQFFKGRLDQPDRFFNFFHDGVRQAYIKDLRSIEKVQEQFSIWRLNYRSGGKNTPRVHHLAVSFIPISPETGEPGRRVHVLLEDLTLIDWGDADE